MTTSLVKLVAKAVNKGLTQARAVESATLTRLTPGTRTPGSLASGTNPTTTSYACKGFVSNERHDKIGDTLVESTDRVVCIVGDSLSVTPSANDRVAIDSKTQPVVDFEGTPALWTLLLRG